MQNRKKKIKIVVIGDDEVGKTSFIASLISDTALKRVEKIIGPVVLPPDMFNWHYDCTTVLIDTSSELQDIDLVEIEVKQADVVLLMYDVTRISTAQRLGMYWMPRIQRVSSKVNQAFDLNQIKIPVVVVGNKIDMQDDEKLDDEIEFQRIFKVIKPLIRNYNQVEMGMECSVKQGKSVTDIIHCCQRAFLFPLAPLYNLSEKQLTINFKKALTRIFRLCDKDQDGRWNDKELMAFQSRVFKRELDQSDINGIKEMIKEELGDISNDNGITLEGFLALQKRGVELIKIQTCWTILRHFKYQDDLFLDHNLFSNQLLVDADAGQSVELSQKGLDYIKMIYRYSIKLDPHLRVSRISDIFYPSESVPWRDVRQIVKSKRINGEDYIDQDQWISLWHQLVYFDYMEAFKQLKYIGYDGGLNDSFVITNKKNSYSEYQKITLRNVYHILLVVKPPLSFNRSLESLIDYDGQLEDKTQPVVITISVQQKTKHIIISLCIQSDLDHILNSRNYSEIDFVALMNEQLTKSLPYPTMMVFKKEKQSNFIESSNGSEGIQEFRQQLTSVIEKPLKYLSQVHIDDLKSQDNLLSRFSGQFFIGVSALASIAFIYLYFVKKRSQFQVNKR